MFMPHVMVKSILILHILVLTVSGTLNSVKPKTDEIVEVSSELTTFVNKFRYKNSFEHCLSRISTEEHGNKDGLSF